MRSQIFHYQKNPLQWTLHKGKIKYVLENVLASKSTIEYQHCEGKEG